MNVPLEHLDKYDEARFNAVRLNLIAIDLEWETYRKPAGNISEVYRGDTESAFNSTPRLVEIFNKYNESTVAASEVVNLEIESPTIMSTTTNPSMEYVSKKSVMWHFSLPKGHRGISEGIYAAEGEITFPWHNVIKIKSVDYLPSGMSYKDEPARYGINHRFIIHAKMLPKTEPQITRGKFSQRPKEFSIPEPRAGEYETTGDFNYAHDLWKDALDNYDRGLYKWIDVNSKYDPERVVNFSDSSAQGGLQTKIIPKRRMVGILDDANSIFDRFEIGETVVDGFSLVTAFNKGGTPSRSGVNRLTVIGHGYEIPDREAFVPKGFTLSLSVPSGMLYKGPRLRDYAKKYDNYLPHSIVSNTAHGPEITYNLTLEVGGRKRHEYISERRITGMDDPYVNDQGGISVRQLQFEKHESDPIIAMAEATAANRHMSEIYTDFLSVQDYGAKKDLGDVFSVVKTLNKEYGSNYTEILILSCRCRYFKDGAEVRRYLASTYNFPEEELNSLVDDELLDRLSYHPSNGPSISDHRSKRGVGFRKNGEISVRIYGEQMFDLVNLKYSPMVVTKIVVLAF